MENGKYKFSRSPMPGLNSRASSENEATGLTTEVQLFKDVYIQERQVLDRFRKGEFAVAYQPASSLDGESKFNTPEERKTTNQWQAMYKKLEQMKQLNPIHYVRVLFYILRGSALTVPSLGQLAAPNTVELVLDFLKKPEDDVRRQFIAESQRTKTAIVILQKGSGYPLSLSVYYALIDSRLELSPLFKYCVATSTCKSLLNTDPHIEKLNKIAKQFEFLAAMDYTLFPQLYTAVLGELVPASFCVAAAEIVSAARC
jgi:hypothetical protein